MGQAGTPDTWVLSPLGTRSAEHRVPDPRTAKAQATGVQHRGQSPQPRRGAGARAEEQPGPGASGHPQPGPGLAIVP